MESYRYYFILCEDWEILECISLSDESVEDANHDTPLVAAIESGRLSLVEGMLRKGFAANRISHSCSPLGAAISAKGDNAESIFAALLESIEPLEQEEERDFCPELTEPLLHAAVRRNMLNAVRLLLEHGADPEWKEPWPEVISAIQLARQLQHLEILELLNDPPKPKRRSGNRNKSNK